jgi:hypothetical protein
LIYLIGLILNDFRVSRNLLDFLEWMKTLTPGLLALEGLDLGESLEGVKELKELEGFLGWFL